MTAVCQAVQLSDNNSVACFEVCPCAVRNGANTKFEHAAAAALDARVLAQLSLAVAGSASAVNNKTVAAT